MFPPPVCSASFQRNCLFTVTISQILRIKNTQRSLLLFMSHFIRRSKSALTKPESPAADFTGNSKFNNSHFECNKQHLQWLQTFAQPKWAAREQDVTVNQVRLTSSPAKSPSWPTQPHMAGRMLPFTSWGSEQRLGVVGGVTENRCKCSCHVHVYTLSPHSCPPLRPCYQQFFPLSYLFS